MEVLSEENTVFTNFITGKIAATTPIELQKELEAVHNAIDRLNLAGQLTHEQFSDCYKEAGKAFIAALKRLFVKES